MGLSKRCRHKEEYDLAVAVKSSLIFGFFQGIPPFSSCTGFGCMNIYGPINYYKYNEEWKFCAAGVYVWLGWVGE